VNRMIYCPACHCIHIDRPEHQEPHVNHTCHHCGETFVVGYKPCVGVDLKGLPEGPRNRESQRRLAKALGIIFDPCNDNYPEAGGTISFVDGVSWQGFLDQGLTKAQVKAFASGKNLAGATALFRMIRGAGVRKLRAVR